MNRINKGIFGTTFLILSVGAGLAQPGPGDMDPQDRGFAGQEKLQLTAEQEQAMEELRFDQQEQMIDLRSKLDKQELELRKLESQEEPNAKKINAQIEKIGATRIEIAKARAAHRMAVDKILTPEQRKQHRKFGPRGDQGRGDACRTDGPHGQRPHRRR